MEKISPTTIINHRIRHALNLSLQEYCVADMLWQLKEYNTLTLLESLRITPKTLTDILNELVAKGIITYPSYGVTGLWLKHFDHNANFEILWNIHKKGSKKVALKRYLKICKKVDFEYLKNHLTEYVASRPPEEFMFLKGLDVYLNPQAEHWNDPIVKSFVPKKKEEENPKRKINNFYA